MKTKSKYILLLFVSIIVLLLGGIFLAAQQEKEGPITAEAAGSYWATPSVCPECGEYPSPSEGSLTFTRQSGGCTYSYTHTFNRGGGKHSGTISIHTAQSHPKVEPTCTAKGHEMYVDCVYCHTLNMSYTEIPALGHDYGDWFVAQAATCTQNGTEQRQCSRCSARETRTIEATGHTWDSGTVTVSATCQRTGTRKYECTACGETKTETIAKRSHNYNIYLSRVEPTCTASGRTAGYECQWCYANTCSTIPALGHDLEYHDGQPATCTEAGWNNYETCSRCEYTTYREIAATGHTPGAAATCTTPQTCTECGAILVEALGHKTVSHLGQDATCTEAGWKPYETCENCDYTTYEEIPALGHSFTSYVSNNDATCTEDGTETAKCDRCEVTDTRTDEGSALGHNWAEEWTTDGTAHWHECSRCDEINDKANHSGGTATCIELAECEVCGVEYGEFAEHVYVENAEEQYLVSAATCTTKATYYKSCSVCGEAGEEIFEFGDPLGHSYGEPEWTWEGYTSATAKFTCAHGCGDVQTVAASGGSITSVVTTPAECEAEGMRTYNAKVMFGGEEYVTTTTETLEALGHDLEHHEAKPATCTEIGWKAYDTCTRCDYTTYVEIEALGHTEGEAVRENEVPASCTVAGSYDEVVYCSVCGEELSREKKTIEALGHSFTSYVSDNNATCVEDGTETAQCDRCEVTDTRTDEGSALGHDWAEEWTTDGTAHWHECSRCDEVNDKANHSGGTATCTDPAKCDVCGVAYGEALGHDLQHHDAQAATCTEIGWDAYDTCSRCDYTTYEEIPALGHTEGEAVRENEVAATCTVAGSYDEVVYCSVCGEELSREEKTIEALGHDWAEEWITDGTAHWHECSRCDEINDKASHSGGTATCTDPAECDVCGVAYGEALGHDLQHHDAQAATCTGIGWNAYDTCSRCEYTTYEEIPALGHTEGEAVRENEVDATCTVVGSYDEVVYCSVCGEELSREEKVIDALGHSFTSYVSDNNATCTEDGTETAKCDRCDVTDTRTDEGSALGHDWAEEWTTDGTAHWHECSRCDEINDKANHSGGTATCIELAECEVCGVEYGDFAEHNYVDGYCTVCGIIDGAALDNDKDDAKTDLDDVAQDAKDEIDASDLPDEVKEDLKDKVDEVINGAKDEVDGSTDFDDVDQAIEDAKDEIADAILDAEKDDAKSDLDEIAQNAKDEIDASDLPDDVKDDLKGKVDEIVTDAKGEIDGETSKEEVDQTVEDAQKEIEDAILNAEKDDAQSLISTRSRRARRTKSTLPIFPTMSRTS